MQFSYTDSRDRPPSVDWAEAWWDSHDETSERFIIRWKQRKTYDIVDGWDKVTAKYIVRNIKDLDAAKAMYIVTKEI